MGLESASTVVLALSARSAVDLKSASAVVSALGARSAVGNKGYSHQIHVPKLNSDFITSWMGP